ncbi:nuclear RNA export factor 1-like [Phymastichus coffea]|uniref:nuclear RNA export factor 1-like n=1 Tax=Phymastichus coffea TaxID=108790 RepID=UPI00273AE01A|nr:nuclear RNA export factor 1-like [Phymastichus coffea]XP_058792393.1 nuclear RNA export factor 1-like [Phymastichus coffea]
MPRKPTNKPFWGGSGGRGFPANNFEDRSRREYFGHDDRMGRPNEGQRHLQNRQRVTFKKPNYKPDPAKKNRFIKLDDDILMSTGSNNNSRPVVNIMGRGKNFSRGRNSPLPRSHSRMDGRWIVNMSDSNWYKIIIQQGNKYTKEFVLSNLLSMMAPCTFTPIAYKIRDNDAVFYVEGFNVANKLNNCDKRISCTDGSKLGLRVFPGQPRIQIDDALKERLKLAMAKRYNQETCALDLSKFHQDSDLASEYFCPLDRSNILQVVLNIVHEHIPGLLALKLDSNKLQNIDRLGTLADKFENLKILYIGDNKIKEVSHLNALRNLQLEELYLEGNPLCSKYKNKKEEYINDIRKSFPKLLKLDGVDLPPPILFDVEDPVIRLPPTQKIFIAQSNTKAYAIASQFFQQYFLVFDSESRQPLLDAYHENALFSMTVNVLPRFSPYHNENCNILRVTEASRRHKLKKYGKLPIVSFISEMPRTKHDLNSFTMDLCIATEGMIFISLTGLFKELNSKDNKELLRYFDRQFIIAPEGAGFCVHEEHLSVSNATPAQKKKADTLVPEQPTPGPSTAPAPIANAAALTEEMKQHMAIQLSQHTKMMPEWSYKCLEEVQWNYDNAQLAFREALSLNKIPPNAFIQ